MTTQEIAQPAALPEAEAALPETQEPAAEAQEPAKVEKPPTDWEQAYKGLQPKYEKLLAQVKTSSESPDTVANLRVQMEDLKRQNQAIMDALAARENPEDAVEEVLEEPRPKRKPSPIEAYKQTAAQIATQRINDQLNQRLTAAGVSRQDFDRLPEFAVARNQQTAADGFAVLELVLAQRAKAAPPPLEEPPSREELARQKVREEGLLKVEKGGPTGGSTTKNKVLDQIISGEISAQEGALKLKALGFTL